MFASAFPEVSFNREAHSYCWRDRDNAAAAAAATPIPLISATTVIGELKPEFDRDGISRMVANRDGKTQEEVLAEWEQKSLNALAKGSAMHAYIEDLLQGRMDAVVEEMNELPELAGFKRAWQRLEKSHGARMEHQELVVGDVELGIAGTVDAVVTLNQPANPRKLKRVWHVFDWKSGKKFESSNRYEKLLPPFQDLDNCHLNVYSLQTSIYRLILERAARRLGLGGGEDVEFADSYLVHLRTDGSHYTYRGRDYRARVEEWLLGRQRVIAASLPPLPAAKIQWMPPTPQAEAAMRLGLAFPKKLGAEFF